MQQAMQNLAPHWGHWTVAGNSAQNTQIDSAQSGAAVGKSSAAAGRRHHRHQRMIMPRQFPSRAF
jgi:hypothetical protein